LLTKFGTESGKINNTKMVDNFYIFLESIDTPAYDQRIRSYDPCKLGVVLLEINSEQIRLSGQVWTLSPLPKELWGNSEYKDTREFYNLSNGG
jgi:hypothetical protein